MKTQKKTGIALALAAAGMMGASVALVTPSVSVAGSNVHCYGVNICKGHNDCKTAKNACTGKASCKGQGYVKMSAKACADVGGTVGK